ncbi:MAG: hypothetical protein K6A96_13910 [Prevotella sp.]|nr:hypothetical protein [Prevotella sp.]
MKIYGIELETPLIKGDVNADKKVNDADIIEVANAIVSKPSENHSTFSRVVQRATSWKASLQLVQKKGRPLL